MRGGEALFLRLGVMTITPNTPQLYGVNLLSHVKLLLRPAERPTMTNEKEPEWDWTCDIQLFVYTNSSLTNYMAISQCTWACERGEDV